MRKLIYTAVALALSSSVYAADLTSTQSASISSISIGSSPSYRISDGEEANNAVTQAVTRSVSFGQFNANTGVLTGISSALTFTGGSMTLSPSGTRNFGDATSFSSNGSVTASTNLIGLSSFGAVNDTLSNACGASGQGNCFQSFSTSNWSSSMTKTDNSWLSPTATVSAGSLNAYVGTGNVASTLTTTASVNLIEETRITNQQARLSLTGLTGNQSLTYSYLRHANASFSSGADTNSLNPTGLTTGTPFAFSIFNLGDSSTTKLDFISLQCTGGDCGAFGVTVPSFQDLIAGSSATGSATLLANAVGNYGATYLLTFKDDTSVGAAASHLTNTLSLSIAGSVAPVPEPGSWALLSLGLIGLAFRARKKK